MIKIGETYWFTRGDGRFPILAKVIHRDGDKLLIESVDDEPLWRKGDWSVASVRDLASDEDVSKFRVAALRESIGAKVSDLPLATLEKVSALIEAAAAHREPLSSATDTFTRGGDNG